MMASEKKIYCEKGGHLIIFLLRKSSNELGLKKDTAVGN